MKTQASPRRRASARACVVCSEPVTTLTPCPSCPGPYHEACATQAPNCGALGCPAGSGADEQKAPDDEPAATPDHEWVNLVQLRRRPGHCAACGERLDPRDTSTCIRFGCDASYHRQCASGARCVGCGYLLGEFHAPWPTTLLLIAGLYTLGSSLVVYTTLPVVHAFSTRALLLLGAYGPLLTALGIFGWTRERYRAHSVAISGPLALGNVVMAVSMIALCAGLAFIKRGGSVAGTALLGVAVLGFVCRRLFHSEVGRHF